MKKILSCGITGKFGYYHSKISLKYGTFIVSGLNYKKKGYVCLNLPIFSSTIKSVKITKCNISILFIPNFFCKNIILENIFSGIKIIICISENISNFDSLKIKYYCELYKVLFIGPNTPGIVLTFDKIRLGLFPIKYILKGNLTIISRSGTLTYEAIKISYFLKIGQNICVGIGGDYVNIFNIKLFLNYFNKYINKILIIGEVGNNIEILFTKLKKKIFFFIVGIFSPLKKTMGHAGALNSKKNDILKKIKKIKKKFIIINNLNNINLIR